MMSKDQVKEFVLARVKVERADIEDAKAFLVTQTGDIQFEQVLNVRTDQTAGIAEVIDPNGPDPIPAIERFVQRSRIQLALCAASWELVHAGILLPMGPPTIGYLKAAWGVSGRAAGGYD